MGTGGLTIEINRERPFCCFPLKVVGYGSKPLKDENAEQVAPHHFDPWIAVPSSWILFTHYVETTISKI